MNVFSSHYWRVRTRLPDRFGKPCRVVVRGRLNSVLVEFDDGYRVVTSRNYVRKLQTSPRKFP
jgi:hypothetical protein